jgi:hypothetical protein
MIVNLDESVINQFIVIPAKETVSQFVKSRHSGRIPHCGIRSGIQNLLMLTGHYWIPARDPLRGTWPG